MDNRAEKLSFQASILKVRWRRSRWFFCMNITWSTLTIYSKEMNGKKCAFALLPTGFDWLFSEGKAHRHLIGNVVRRFPPRRRRCAAPKWCPSREKRESLDTWESVFHTLPWPFRTGDDKHARVIDIFAPWSSERRRSNDKKWNWNRKSPVRSSGREAGWTHSEMKQWERTKLFFFFFFFPSLALCLLLSWMAMIGTGREKKSTRTKKERERERKCGLCFCQEKSLSTPSNDIHNHLDVNDEDGEREKNCDGEKKETSKRGDPFPFPFSASEETREREWCIGLVSQWRRTTANPTNSRDSIDSHAKRTRRKKGNSLGLKSQVKGRERERKEKRRDQVGLFLFESIAWTGRGAHSLPQLICANSILGERKTWRKEKRWHSFAFIEIFQWENSTGQKWWWEERESEKMKHCRRKRDKRRKSTLSCVSEMRLRTFLLSNPLKRKKHFTRRERMRDITKSQQRVWHVSASSFGPDSESVLSQSERAFS